MPPIRAVALLALFLIGHPGRGTAQTIRRSTLDSIALRPPALADSTPVYRAALEGGLDSLLARAGNSRYYIQIPHEAVPAATELIPPLIRARRAKGWCVWDRKDSHAASLKLPAVRSSASSRIFRRDSNTRWW